MGQPPTRTSTARGLDDRGTDDRGTDTATATAAPAVAAPAAWAPQFTEGVAHNHAPCGRWPEIQAKPQSIDLRADQACRHFEPATVARMAKTYLGSDARAVAHLEHYLTGGGVDYDEDANLAAMLAEDEGVRALVARQVLTPNAAPKGRFRIEQRDYAVSDFLGAFGGIDIVEYEVLKDRDMLRVWFKDRYEWHPVYDGLYDRQAGDSERSNNCVHAAMVEMKSQGAADFWMVGKAVIPLSSLPAPQAAGAKGRSEWSY